MLMALFLDEKARNAPLKTIKCVEYPQDLKRLDVKPDDVVRHLGYTFTWTGDCVGQEECDIWRTQADPLCDAALDTLLSHSDSDHILVGQDLFDLLETKIEAAPSPPVVQFWEEINSLPPHSCLSDDDYLTSRALFLDCAVQMIQALTFASLAGGFASPRIVRVLQATSYLVPPSTDQRVFRRLAETLQFYLEVMGCRPDCSTSQNTDTTAFLLPGGEGWKAIIRVRMLHAIARRRAAKKWDAVLTGNHVPISQEDMSATLASFSAIPLFILGRLHLTPAAHQSNAYTAHWRHIGYYLGVNSCILDQYFSSAESSAHFLGSMLIQLFENQNCDLNHQQGPTIPLLRAISNRPGISMSLPYNYALVNHFIGLELSSRVGVPAPSWMLRNIMTPLSLLLQTYPALFARQWGKIRPGYQTKRRFILKASLWSGVYAMLGKRRTLYRPTNDGELTNQILDKESVESEASHKASDVARMWREIFAEMILVTSMGLLGVSIGLAVIINKCTSTLGYTLQP